VLEDATTPAQSAPGHSGMPRYVRFVLLVIPLLCAALCRWQVEDVTLSKDSRAYLRMARDMTGQVWYPPLYPLLLRATQASVSAPHKIAILNAVLLAALCAAVVYWYSATRAHWFIAAGIPIFLTLAGPFIYVYRWAWSEPLCLLCMMLWLICLHYAVTTRSISYFIASALFAASAAMTRYAGISLILVGCAAFLAWAPHRRFLRATAYGLVAATPVAAWLARNMLTAHTATGRSITFEWPTAKSLNDFFVTGCDWLWPATRTVAGSLQFALGVVAWAVLLSACFVALRRSLRGYTPLRLLALSILIYLALSFATRCLADHALPFDNRLLVPIYLWAVLALGLLADRAIRRVTAWISALRIKRTETATR